MELEVHFACEKVLKMLLTIQDVHVIDQVIDILTNVLLVTKF